MLGTADVSSPSAALGAAAVGVYSASSAGVGRGVAQVTRDCVTARVGAIERQVYERGAPRTIDIQAARVREQEKISRTIGCHQDKEWK